MNLKPILEEEKKALTISLQASNEDDEAPDSYNRGWIEGALNTINRLLDKIDP